MRALGAGRPGPRDAVVAGSPARRAPPRVGRGCAGHPRASRATSARGRGSAPWSARSAGRTKSRKHTTADTGLPGRPNTSVGSRVPNQTGLPGFSATRQKRSSTPSVASAGLTWSCGPTDTPPETATTSASSSAPASDRLAWPRDRRAPPRRALPRRRPPRPARPARRRCCCGSGPGPGRLRARRARRRWRAPPPADGARTARRPGPPRRRWRARPGRAPCRRSARASPRAGPPRRRGCWRAGPHRSRGRPRRRVPATCSTGTTLSAPAGTAAPVEMRIASPSPTAAVAGRPACDSSTTRSSRPAGPARTA